MSHRQEDNYGFVATETIKRGQVIAFNPGDPVPDDTVKALGLEDDGRAVKRADWKGLPEDEPERAQERGEMPPHLRTKETESATDKTAAAGGASRKSPASAKKTDS